MPWRHYVPIADDTDVQPIIDAKGTIDEVIFLGIAGASDCDGPYGSALAAPNMQAIAAPFVAAQRGLFWDLCQGDLETAFQQAIDNHEREKLPMGVVLTKHTRALVVGTFGAMATFVLGIILSLLKVKLTLRGRVEEPLGPRVGGHCLGRKVQVVLLAPTGECDVGRLAPQRWVRWG